MGADEAVESHWWCVLARPGREGEDVVMDKIYDALYKQGLVRSDSNKWIGGVCGGIARKFQADANAVRALTVAAMVLLPGSPLLLYPIAWILMPGEDYRPELPPGSYPPVSEGPQDSYPPRS